ncbi:hypothetical protein CXG81DRAFT_25449 [Caulochytrium protostelioides]|uniref:Potassium channel domain-containing protein n=1 Tax=Caulochytrium protostelioides TaxID=1555241 RepID=A0A4P9X9B7_9FUNG|nr:hypothetical protein CXG81DRAFT_25449 [Caulochytrium protostelioides]|eukprot:RKP01885.1 hypothetical protein CXG81DRAFT_25449 [Caulochytrium protostelioides]
MWGKFVPLCVGVLGPFCTFLAFQATTVPGWILRSPLTPDHDCDPALSALSHISRTGYHRFHAWDAAAAAADPDAAQALCARTYVESTAVRILGQTSFSLSLVALCALVVRVLERKIKWATRILVAGHMLSSLVSIVSLALLALAPHWLGLPDLARTGVTLGDIDQLGPAGAEEPAYRYFYSEGAVFAAGNAVIAALLSGSLLLHLRSVRDRAKYPYLLGFLTDAQRQLVLTQTALLFYLCLLSDFIAGVEGWRYSEAQMFALLSITSVGSPQAPASSVGMLGIMLLTPVGLGLVGTTIWAAREVVLEVSTENLLDRLMEKYAPDTNEDNGSPLSANGVNPIPAAVALLPRDEEQGVSPFSPPWSGRSHSPPPSSSSTAAAPPPLPNVDPTAEPSEQTPLLTGYTSSQDRTPSMAARRPSPPQRRRSLVICSMPNASSLPNQLKSPLAPQPPPLPEHEEDTALAASAAAAAAAAAASPALVAPAAVAALTATTRPPGPTATSVTTIHPAVVAALPLAAPTPTDELTLYAHAPVTQPGDAPSAPRLPPGNHVRFRQPGSPPIDPASGVAARRRSSVVSLLLSSGTLAHGTPPKSADATVWPSQGAASAAAAAEAARRRRFSVADPLDSHGEAKRWRSARTGGGAKSARTGYLDPDLQALYDNAEQRTMIVQLKRSSDANASLAFVSNEISGRDIVMRTQHHFRSPIRWASGLLLASLLLFGLIFSYLEGWSWLAGCYYCFCILLTLGGPGNMDLTQMSSHACLVWFLFQGIGLMTFLSSILAEVALDRWVVTIEDIHQREERYERKGSMKRRRRELERAYRNANAAAVNGASPFADPSAASLHDDPSYPFTPSHADHIIPEIDGEDLGYSQDDDSDDDDESDGTFSTHSSPTSTTHSLHSHTSRHTHHTDDTTETRGGGDESSGRGASRAHHGGPSTHDVISAFAAAARPGSGMQRRFTRVLSQSLWDTPPSTGERPRLPTSFASARRRASIATLAPPPPPPGPPPLPHAHSSPHGSVVGGPDAAAGAPSPSPSPFLRRRTPSPPRRGKDRWADLAQRRASIALMATPRAEPRPAGRSITHHVFQGATGIAQLLARPPLAASRHRTPSAEPAAWYDVEAAHARPDRGSRAGRGITPPGAPGTPGRDAARRSSHTEGHLERLRAAVAPCRRARGAAGARRNSEIPMPLGWPSPGAAAAATHDAGPGWPAAAAALMLRRLTESPMPDDLTAWPDGSPAPSASREPPPPPVLPPRSLLSSSWRAPHLDSSESTAHDEGSEAPDAAARQDLHDVPDPHDPVLF